MVKLQMMIRENRVSAGNPDMSPRLYHPIYTTRITRNPTPAATTRIECINPQIKRVRRKSFQAHNPRITTLASKKPGAQRKTKKATPSLPT